MPRAGETAVTVILPPVDYSLTRSLHGTQFMVSTPIDQFSVSTLAELFFEFVVVF